jgi:glycosyltransferase involved in cell wall biosynthesis
LDEKVEILALLDNKKCSIAAKRNNLLQHAQGDYLAFLDDDDDISADYIASLIDASKSGADVITFEQFCRIEGKPLKVSFGLGNPHEPLVCDTNGNYKDILRPPYHVCGWKSAIAKQEQFRHVISESGQSCEDIDWCLRLYIKCATSYHIPTIIHYYTFSSATTSSLYPV